MLVLILVNGLVIFHGVTMNNLYIGASSNSGGVILPFDGKLSNLSIFNEALTSTEVLKLYSNGMPHRPLTLHQKI